MEFMPKFHPLSFPPLSNIVISWWIHDSIFQSNVRLIICSFLMEKGFPKRDRPRRGTLYFVFLCPHELQSETLQRQTLSLGHRPAFLSHLLLG